MTIHETYPHNPQTARQYGTGQTVEVGVNNQPKATANKTKKRGILSVIRYPVYFAGGVVGAFLLYRSWGLYQVSFAKLGLTDRVTDVCAVTNSIPFLGGMVDGLCTGVGGFLVGATPLISLVALTLLQSLPSFVFFHRGSIQQMVEQLRSQLTGNPLMATQAGDTREIAGLIARHNKLNESALKTLLMFSVAAFLCEGWIIWNARSGRADLTAVLLDALAFDVLVVGLLVFRNAFKSVPKGRKF